jgi:phage baseplate assembly protein W
MANIKTTIAQRYSDLDLKFTIHPVKKDINIYKDELAVINALKNLILTNHYERPFQPELGSNVRKLLFENMDMVTAGALEKEITQTINNFEPRVEVLGIIVSPDFDNNSFKVTLNFTIINRTDPVTISFLLERIR